MTGNVNIPLKESGAASCDRGDSVADMDDFENSRFLFGAVC